MLYTKAEKIGKISKLTLGTVQLGMEYGMANTTGQPSRRQAFEILDAATEVGVNSLDTAVAYGTSEQVIGEYLKEGRNGFKVTSKFKVLGADPVTEFEAQKKHTIDSLGSVDCYFFHDVRQMELYGNALRESLEKMKEAGETKLVGASVYEAADVESFLDFDWLSAIQIPMNILDDRIVRSGLLEELQKRRITVFVRSVFLQGLLCMDRAPKKYDFLIPHVEAFRQLAAEEGMSLRELAVSYIRDLPGVSSLVLGCETAAQVKDNARLFCAKKISAAGVDGIRHLAAKVPIEEVMARIMGRK